MRSWVQNYKKEWEIGVIGPLLANFTVSHSILCQTLVLVAGFAAGTITAFTTGTVAFAAGTTLTAVAALTTGTLATGCALALYVAFGLGLERTHRQAILAGLLVDFDELDLYLVAFLQARSLHVFETLP